ncbi:hypothetical protein ACH4SP_18120 [Streptomyces sp. NPDC021093]|uniref:hypothetical protein n=1 Tax=Streptomyces sp. NPDC021093 TaxID=3365112 RepID=UPI0037B2BC0E
MTEPVPYATTSLGDLLPALRFADPQLLGARLDDVRLPLGWWHATPLMDIEKVIGPEALSHRVAQTVRALWPHVELGDLMPVLRMIDARAETVHRTVAQVTREAGATVGDGDAALACVVGDLLDRLHGRGGAEQRLGAREAVAVIARWLPADAPEEVRAAVAVLVEEAGEPGGGLGAEPAAASAVGVVSVVAVGHVVSVPALVGDVGTEGPEGTGEESPEAGGVPIGAEDGPAGAADLDGVVEPVLLEDPSAAFEELVATWEVRETAIAGQRIFAEQPERLAELGERFSVSRERVRQLEQSVVATIARWLAADGRAFAGHLAAVAGQLGTVTRTTEVRAAHPGHQRVVVVLGVPLGEVVARLLPDRTLADGWIVAGDAEELRTAMNEELMAACGDKPLPWDEACALGARYGIRGEILADWVAEVGRFRAMDGFLVFWGRTVNDRAAAVLALHGGPLPAEDVHAKLEDGTALVSLRNQLWTDERFVRLDRDLYGLRQWGGEEYLGIREMIIRDIRAAGGEMEIPALVDGLTSRFDVSAASVRTNLSGPDFERSRRGWVRVADRDNSTPYVPRSDVFGTRRCFLGGDGRWWYRLEITGDHLRGSGFPVPAGWGAHVGAVPSCEPIPLRHDAGETVLQWRSQPVLGSVRPLLEHIGALAGDQVFLNITDGELNALRLPADTDGTRPEQSAARLTGWTAPVTAEEAVAVIGRRIGMESAQESAPETAALLVRLAERGDRDIAEHLERALGRAAAAC